MPLAGRRRTATPMLIIACTPKMQASPVPASRVKGIAFRHQPDQRAHHDHGIKRQDQQDQDQPVFLGRDGDDEIGMGIGQRPFHLPLAHADAEEAALLDGVGGIAKLGARVDVGRQEAVDPAGEMLGRAIGDSTPRPATMPDEQAISTIGAPATK
jgi:hypothetical protein